MAETRRSRSLLDSALATGALTTIATCGALIGLGLRDGEASRVFRLVGRGLLERAGVASADAPLTSVAVGYLHHLIIATLWGAVLGVIILKPRTWVGRVIAVIGCAIGYVALSLRLLPPSLRIGYAVTSNASTVVPIGVALVLALLGDLWIDATETRA